MKVLVCGGRGFENYSVVQHQLGLLHKRKFIDLIITGGAKGADRLAERWAEFNRVPLAIFPANWHYVGKSAGPVRNRSMLLYGRPDLVVAFPGSNGTADMIRQARRACIQVIEWQKEDSGASAS